MLILLSILLFLLLSILTAQFAVASVVAPPSVGTDEPVEFNAEFIKQPKGQKIDLTRFTDGLKMLPGVYKLTISLNTVQLAVADVEFKMQDDGKNRNVVPCIPFSVFTMINFKKEEIYFTQWDSLADSKQCIDVKKIIPESSVDFDSETLQLNISIPQIYINKQPRGSVPSSMWDSGIPALMLGYNMNAYQSENSGYESKSFYTSVNSGLNIGSWYLRHNGSWSWANHSGGKYSVINTYIQHDLAFISGRLVAGQSNTSGQLFDTVPFTGVQVASDERMLPESQRGYAPEIRGIAKTNAKVTVSQSGQKIYETTVSPGSFVIDDLYPTGYGGNLDVTIEEADGTQQNYSIPYSSVSQLLRPGSHRYSFSVGKLRSDSVSGAPQLLEGTFQHGFNNIITAYTGIQASQDYLAVKIGTALGLAIGAVSFDITQSRTKLPASEKENLSGQSYQLSYSKLIDETNSNITLAAYRFSSSGYMDYITAMQTIDALKNQQDSSLVRRQKNRFTLNISQGLPEAWGQIYLSASLADYWGQDNFDRQYQFGYSNRYKWLNYSLNVSRSQDAFGESQTSYFLNFSFPLGSDSIGQSVPQVSLGYNQDTSGRTGEQVMISGSAGADNQYTYNASGAYDSDAHSSGNVGGSWRGSIAQMSGSYSKGSDYSSTSLGMTGTLVAHSGGVTFSPYTGDTFALIEAKGATGASISSYQGTKVDRFGYALFPAQNPYQLDDVIIDPKGMSRDVELKNTSQKIVPRYGAVVKVKFDTEKGTPVLISATQAGKILPFGADVFDDTHHNVGVVAQGSTIYARVAKPKGQLQVRWGEDISSQCVVSYMLTPVEEKGPEVAIQRFSSECH